MKITGYRNETYLMRLARPIGGSHPCGQPAQGEWLYTRDHRAVDDIHGQRIDVVR